MQTTILVEDWLKDNDWIHVVDAVAIIGRGKDANKYKYVPNVSVFVINSALQFYPTANYVVMLAPHYRELKDLPLFKDSIIINFPKAYYVGNKLICGCTPSIFISFLLKNMKQVSTIYLQGFSMDEEKNTAYPTQIKKNMVYDWNRQIKAFERCQALANEKKINLVLINENSRLPFIQKGIPKKEHLQHG